MNPYISLLDETYNSDYSETYLLCLYKNNDFLAYCIIDSVRKKYIAIRAFLTADKYFEDQVNEDKFLKLKYKKTFVVYHSPLALLFPSSVATNETSEKIFSFTFDESPDNHLLLNSSVNDNINCVFRIPENEKSFFASFNETRILHPYSILIQNSLKLSRSSVYLACELFKNGIILCAAKGGDLLYCNYFNCQSPADFAYLVTGLYKNLNLSCDEIPLNYSGITQKKDERLEEISRFIKRTNPRNCQSDYLFSYRFNEIQSHNFSILFDAHNEDNQR